ncbi:hypothetical protein GCM10027400_00270 [Pseudoxanthomonas daejeonensis]
MALTFAAWQWLRGEGRALPAALAALAGICAYNGNGWVLVALPLIRVLGKTKAELPRWRWTFLGYYVGHLVVLATISGGMDVSGNVADPAGAVAGSTRTVDQ